MDTPAILTLNEATGRRLSLVALVVVNLIPLAGVLVWGWDVGSLVVLYWSENLIIGAYTIVKMLACSPIGGLGSSLFFLIHYGGFCAVHGIFVLALATDVEPKFFEGEPWPLFLVFVQLLISVIQQVLSMAPPEWIVAFIALAISHGLSLVLNYFRNGEYRTQTVQSLMGAPYKRIVVLHVAILFGGFGVMALGSPLPLLVLLVGLKLMLDVWLHLREHRTSDQDGSPEQVDERAQARALAKARVAKARRQRRIVAG
ncbi:MAG: DUF6498-containing protein [Pseudomonadales bacterium]